jgi:hypothetical protein
MVSEREHCLESYYQIIIKKDNPMEKKISLFLDSGAFSAWSKGVTIDIDEYIAFIKQHKKYIDHYAVLDSIGDPETTLQNQEYMESKGLSPIPCFHYGENIKYLKSYIKKYEYIALGGMVPISTNDLFMWLDDLYTNYICDSSGMPKVKVHGFGLTSIPLLVRYPWYSVDSTSWVMTGRFGAVFVPKKKQGSYIYTEIPWKVNVSDKSSKKDQEGQHFNTFSKMEQKIISDYFSEKGYTIQQLSSEYKKRDEINIHYFIDLEKNLPKWPWALQIKKKSSLGLV